MNVFELKNKMIEDYSSYLKSFIKIEDSTIREAVNRYLEEGNLWPEALIQLNPAFEPGGYIHELVEQGLLHPECLNVFRIQKNEYPPGIPMRLHYHQTEAIKAARENKNYVVTTGTGSGKSLAYVIPIVDYVLRSGSEPGIKAIIIYPMNALVNSQEKELKKFLCDGYPSGRGPVTFRVYTGQNDEKDREEIRANPPDILLTNYMMMELILTRDSDRLIIEAAKNLKFLVLDELHTYRGRQGADVAMMLRRLRHLCGQDNLRCIGTSATLAGEGSYDEQRQEAARVASMLFGAPVEPEGVITETLRRTTVDFDLNSESYVERLRDRVKNHVFNRTISYEELCPDPLYSWIETVFGLTWRDGHLVRQEPVSLGGDQGAAARLSQVTGLDRDFCIEVLQDALLTGYNCRVPNLERPALAFRLHQFISKADTVYASLEDEGRRYITFSKQQFVPNSEGKILLPLGFCRECGQAYYVMTFYPGTSENQRNVEGREIYEPLRNFPDNVIPGFLYLNSANPWPEDMEQIINRVPDEWLEEHPSGLRIRRERQRLMPQKIKLNPMGLIDNERGLEFCFMPAPFSFCLNCGVSYNLRQRTDIQKLVTLDTGGRSSATTVLSLSAIRNLRLSNLPTNARKLLSFTDNRQDASLQAGHFNDFMEVGLLRAGIYKAISQAGVTGLRHHELPLRVFEALNLPFEEYASNPEAMYAAREDTNEALRLVLGYRIYCDLRRGWRVNMPNLEQCGLLKIEYLSLEEICQDQRLWEDTHEPLRSASPETRFRVLTVLLDFMRRELAIKVDYLRREYQEQIVQRSNQRLIPPWGIDENEARNLEYATILFPQVRPRSSRKRANKIFLSGYSGFAQYLTRYNTFPNYTFTSRRGETPQLIRDMLNVLAQASLVEIVSQPDGNNEVPGYQLVAASMIWKAGDGTQPYHDPIRVPNISSQHTGGNTFFIEYYQRTAAENLGIQAREHTAQVPNHIRQEREEMFREAKIPILYCSPTMELGVDIAELNMVNMRNIPPSPANYAQRSGRAGRQGQPALVFSYCTTGSSHDQYYFRRPGAMVAGAVTPPRIDLANEDFIRSHVHAMWLTESRLSLGNSLMDILDVRGDEPSLKLLPSVVDTLNNESVRKRAQNYARQVLRTVEEELRTAGWYDEKWLEQVLRQITLNFNEACDRWRTLYKTAFYQIKLQQAVILDHSRSAADHARAKSLRREAEDQLEILCRTNDAVSDDFYSYRYFASEGFLPGYNFARLPLSAYIAGRKTVRNRDEYISRPRFLAISEFGPRALIYHEGSRYQVNRVLLPLDRLDGQELPTKSIKICPECGYLHILNDGVGPDLCEHCHEALGQQVDRLFMMQNVSTKRRDKITSDEEERSREGFDILTVIRFAERQGESLYRSAEIMVDGELIARLYYGQGAEIWRINQGRKRRRQKDNWGFNLDIERGYWVPESDQDSDNPEDQDPVSPHQTKVIPYVRDLRNCLLFEPVTPLNIEIMASLQSALKKAIQVEYQLEENEIAVEPLPSSEKRRRLLFYEASEGGAGVLRRLVDEPRALPNLAWTALEICHYDPHTGEDLRHAPHSKEECEAACYDCLMSYSNQPDHLLMRRDLLKPYLEILSCSEVKVSPGELTRAQHLQQLMNMAGSELERSWLRLLEELGCRLPSRSQVLIRECHTRPDFIYDEPYHVVIYVDGPPHDYPERQERDRQQQEALENLGYQVIRFGYRQDWEKIINLYPALFGIK